MSLLLVGLSSCDRAASAPSGLDAGACPACECDCEQQAGSTGDDTLAVAPDAAGVAAAAGSDEVGALAASASRKMMHGEGETCLADLDRLRKLSPQTEAQLAVLRGQCEMLVGRCQAGKARVAAWYVREAAMTTERAERTAESIGAMRCRGGDATERDRLLVALQDLADGAYMNRRDVAFCQTRIALVRELGPKVPPRDAEDTQVTGGQQALFHTGAMCLARAGDCAAAYRTYAELFPGHGLDQIQDPALRRKVIRDAFDSAVVLCEGKLPAVASGPP